MATERVRVELDGRQLMRLLSSGQALRMPSRFYGVTHKQARQIITDIVGYCPKGKPEKGTMEAVQEWLGMEPVDSVTIDDTDEVYTPQTAE